MISPYMVTICQEYNEESYCVRSRRKNMSEVVDIGREDRDLGGEEEGQGLSSSAIDL